MMTLHLCSQFFRLPLLSQRKFFPEESLSIERSRILPPPGEEKEDLREPKGDAFARYFFETRVLSPEIEKNQ